MAAISEENIICGCIAACMGLLLGCVGLDPITGATERLTFGIAELSTGIDLIAALIAFFCVAEMLNQGGRKLSVQKLPEQTECQMREVLDDFFRNKFDILKSIFIGTFIGILPGTGPTIASWIAYSNTSKEKIGEPPLGEGAPRGIIAPEVANNAVTGGATIPLLTLGIPGDTVTAVLLGALMIQNVAPGPFFILENGSMFATIIISLMLGNLFILIFGLSLRKMAARMLTFSPAILLPIIGILAATGGFAAGNSAFNVLLIGILGVGGHMLSRIGLPMAPLVLGIVLAPIIERNLRDALVVHNMNYSIFITRPISAILLIAAVFIVGFVLFHICKKRIS